MMELEKNKTEKRKRRILFGAAAAGLIISAVMVFLFTGKQEEEESVVYKETRVEYGTLTVGITKSGSVDIGTVEQTFALDMSALQRVDTTKSTDKNTGDSGGAPNFGNAGGMMPAGGMGAPGTAPDLFGQMLGGSGNLTKTGDDFSLKVAGVSVSVGQQVEKGDILYEIEAESVFGLEEELQTNVEKAKTDLDAVYADQILSKQTAKYTYESSIAYGSYAETEYTAAVRELNDTVEDNRITLERAQVSLAEYQARLEDITESYEDALQIVKNCEYSLNSTSPSNAGNYVYYYELTESAKSTADSLEKQKEQLENSVEQAQENVEKAAQNYNVSLRESEKGQLSAKQTYDLRNLAYATARETYDITLANLEEDAAAQEKIYEEAKEKWEEYSSYISGNAVLAQYSGVITGVELKKGDSISTDSLLVTLYDMEDVTMTVTVDERDMDDISLGVEADIGFTAYPEEIFTAQVTEISDASTDSEGNVVYDVTVTLEGDISELFQGMTGDITFVTSQSEETLYIYKRAVITENEKNYVKIRDEEGNIVKKEITTGFTDGTYIQVTEGLSEGDIVLIESKVEAS